MEQVVTAQLGQFQVSDALQCAQAGLPAWRHVLCIGAERRYGLAQERMQRCMVRCQDLASVSLLTPRSPTMCSLCVLRCRSLQLEHLGTGSIWAADDADLLIMCVMFDVTYADYL